MKYPVQMAGTQSGTDAPFVKLYRSNVRIVNLYSWRPRT